MLTIIVCGAAVLFTGQTYAGVLAFVGCVLIEGVLHRNLN